MTDAMGIGGRGIHRNVQRNSVQIGDEMGELLDLDAYREKRLREQRRREDDLILRGLELGDTAVLVSYDPELDIDAD